MGSGAIIDEFAAAARPGFGAISRRAVAGGNYLSGQQYITESERSRLVANSIADHIYEQLTGKEGNFETDDKH
jgi:hypothetical protein